jgi:dienelactone hydrolase
MSAWISKKVRGTSILILVVAVAAFVCSAAGASENFDPQKPGPYPVGVTTVTLVDPSRTDPATNGPRTLLTEIWYPAIDAARDMPKNKASDFLLKGSVPGMYQAVALAFKMKMDEYDKTFKNEAVRDAPIRDGKYPLIVFSHGNGGIRNQSTFWCDYMASHGYVIAAPDHTGNAALTAVNGKMVVMNGQLREFAAENRPKDVSFVIDMMNWYSKGGDSRFNQRIDMGKIGVAGHSFGGYTSIHVINSDPRIDAIIPMTPVWEERTNYATPVMMMVATEDKTIGIKGNDKARQYYAESKGPSYLVEILDAGHFSFSDMFQIQPNYGDGVGTGVRITKNNEPMTFLSMEETYAIINSYSAAFFGLYVKGVREYQGFIEKNHYGEKVVHKFQGHPAPEIHAAGNGGGQN